MKVLVTNLTSKCVTISGLLVTPDQVVLRAEAKRAFAPVELASNYEKVLKVFDEKLSYSKISDEEAELALEGHDDQGTGLVDPLADLSDNAGGKKDEQLNDLSDNQQNSEDKSKDESTETAETSSEDSAEDVNKSSESENTSSSSEDKSESSEESEEEKKVETTAFDPEVVKILAESNKKPDLVEACTKQGLDTYGTKEELAERLVKAGITTLS
jgi:hypothetical protein